MQSHQEADVKSNPDQRMGDKELDWEGVGKGTEQKWRLPWYCGHVLAGPKD